MDLAAAKEYVETLLKNVKIRRSESPYGTSLLFVREEEKLIGFLDKELSTKLRRRTTNRLKGLTRCSIGLED